MSDVVKRLLELSQSMMEGYPLNDGDFTDIDEAIMLIERLIVERDEARRVAAYQYAKHHNGDEDTLVKNFFEFRGWDCFKEDGK